MLETQSTAQAKAAARAKIAIRQAAQADLEPLTRAQLLARCLDTLAADQLSCLPQHLSHTDSELF